MKYYLANFIQHDGEHEHLEHAVLSADSDDEAKKICAEQLYECGEEREGSLFAFGDGETAIGKYDLVEVSESEFAVLARYISSLTELDFAPEQKTYIW